ncbi:MAG: hypothetical protein ABJE95_31410 [Byssovorax sp.]
MARSEIAALLLLAACKSAPQQELPPPPASVSAPLAAAVSAAPSASPAPVVSAAPEDPFFGPRRLPGTRGRETVREAGGVLLGVPAGWETTSVYDAYDVATPKKGDLQQAGAYYLALGGKVGARGDMPDPKELARLAYILRMVKTTWDPPYEARVSPRGYRGQIARGRGVGLSAAEGEKEAFAAVVEIPTRKSIIFLGAWMTSHPEHEASLIDMLRMLEPCEFKPAKGCVPVAP